MKKILFAAVMMSLVLTMSGCGGGDSSNPPTPIVTQIHSRAAFDGDIQFDPPNLFTIVQGNTPSVFAGVHPVTGSEFRAFLDFPLTGAGGVPGSAIINSATLDIFIDSISIQPVASSIPIRIELVTFPPQTLLASDFNRTIQPALALTTIIPPISRADVSRHVTVDVTSLMVQAQRSGLTDFQIRILEDDGFVFPGLIEIDDTTINRAPLLTVSFF
ncbi:hypothetical protein ACFOFO_21890 [Undibacterium arcticum]|uniref:Lipoprotein n=1 Tax=Undibacterium arcticum TaxID=1762892 RepID=A0ABV7F9Y5_9BURK